MKFVPTIAPQELVQVTNSQLKFLDDWRIVNIELHVSASVAPLIIVTIAKGDTADSEWTEYSRDVLTVFPSHSAAIVMGLVKEGNTRSQELEDAVFASLLAAGQLPAGTLV